MSDAKPRTWRRHRASPLRLPSYPAGHPVHVAVRTHRRRPVFASPALARVVFTILRSHERTVAAVLMPDHLHWILDCAEKAPGAVKRFKSLSTRLAWERGVEGQLWQRSYFDRVVRHEDGLEEMVRYVLANPQRAGLVAEPFDYRWGYDRFGLSRRAEI